MTDETNSLDIGEDFLAHYGVKGMHWGIRKSRKQTGISRSSGALIDQNKRRIHQIELARTGKGYRATAAIGKAFVGAERQQKNWNTMTRELKAQNRRLSAGGPTSWEDRMAKFNRVALDELYVSVTPNRRDPHWNR